MNEERILRLTPPEGVTHLMIEWFKTDEEPGFPHMAMVEHHYVKELELAPQHTDPIAGYVELSEENDRLRIERDELKAKLELADKAGNELSKKLEDLEIKYNIEIDEMRCDSCGRTGFEKNGWQWDNDACEFSCPECTIAFLSSELEQLKKDVRRRAWQARPHHHRGDMK